MEIVRNIDGFSRQVETAIALGTFDGVHIAHKQVINEAVNSDFTPAIFTFNQSPTGVISGSKVATLTTKSLKEKYVADLGVELFICPDFLDVKDLSPEEFFDILATKFGAKKIVSGYNFRFGKNREGSAQVLKGLCKKHKIKFVVIPPVMNGDAPISSTRIRKHIFYGEIAKAKELLGYDFAYDFEVVEGNHLGSTWDIPTINQKLPLNFIVPRFGVYASKTEIDGTVYHSITNIGVKPTIGSDCASSETFVFDYKGDLYGKKVLVSLFYFIRAERKFDDTDELARAIKNDINYVKNMIY